MEDKYNSEIIINTFRNTQYIEKSEIINALKDSKHIEIRKLLNRYNILKPWDTNRSCGKCNYFDIAEIKTNKTIDPKSKLVVTRPTNDPNSSNILVYHNWYDKYNEIREKILIGLL